MRKTAYPGQASLFDMEHEIARLAARPLRNDANSLRFTVGRMLAEILPTLPAGLAA